VSTRWALGSGYVPIRKSVAEDPRIQEVWSRWEYNRAPFDGLAHAHPEPNLANWQEVRKLVERAASSVLSGLKSGRQAALELKQQADAALVAS
jgi:maltose-binding protein MalE